VREEATARALKFPGSAVLVVQETAGSVYIGGLKLDI